MASVISVIVINAIDPRTVVDFWSAVLGWDVLDEEDGIVSIGGAGAPFTIDVCRVHDDKTVYNRLHFDLRADGVSRDEELERLLALGATYADVGQPADASWTVLADPEGNEFCLLSRTVQEL